MPESPRGKRRNPSEIVKRNQSDHPVAITKRDLRREKKERLTFNKLFCRIAARRRVASWPAERRREPPRAAECRRHLVEAV